MPACKTPPTPRKASGQNIEDWQRKTERITLRLPKKEMELLYSLSTEVASDGGMFTIDGQRKGALAKTVIAALHALEREMDRESKRRVDPMHDIRPKGTVEVPCAKCDAPGKWCAGCFPQGRPPGKTFFWVDALDPRLPDGPFVCSSCEKGQTYHAPCMKRIGEPTYRICECPIGCTHE